MHSHGKSQLSEIFLSCFGEGDQATAPRDSDGVMRVAGYHGYRRCDMPGSCAYVFIGTAEALSGVRDEDAEGEKRGVSA